MSYRNYYALTFLFSLLLTGCYQEPFEADNILGNKLSENEYNIANCYVSLPWYLEGYAQCVHISEAGGYLHTRSNGLPPHATFFYDNSSKNFVMPEDDINIDEQGVLVEKLIYLAVPKSPESKDIEISSDMIDGEQGTNEHEYPKGVVGIAINGVPFIKFHSEGPIEATLDSYNGHVDEASTYHYHGPSKGALEVLEYEGSVDNPVVGEAEKEIYGIMCDGTIVLGCTELNGSEPDSSDFDAQNGHSHTMKKKWGKSFLKNRYHVHICPDRFPGVTGLPEIQYYSECEVKVTEIESAP